MRASRGDLNSYLLLKPTLEHARVALGVLGDPPPPGRPHDSLVIDSLVPSSCNRALGQAPLLPAQEKTVSPNLTPDAPPPTPPKIGHPEVQVTLWPAKQHPPAGCLMSP